MNKILFLSYRWDDKRLHLHSTDKMIGNAFRRLGWEVFYCDFRDYPKKYNINENNNEMFKQIVKINPQIVFITKGEKVKSEIIKRARSNGFTGKVVTWYNDIRKTPPTCVINIAKVSNFQFHCKSGKRLKEYFNLTQTPCSFLPSCYDAAYVKYKHYNERSINLSWLGQIYEGNQWESHRKDILPKVKKYIDYYAGCWDKDFVRGEKYYKVLGNSKYSINIPAINMPMYFSNRLSHIIGSGSIPFCMKFEGFDNMFEDGKNIISFCGVNDLMNKIQEFSTINISDNVLNFGKKFLESEVVANEILTILDSGKSTYPFGKVVK